MSSDDVPFKSIAVVGVGLIGGSIALAAKQFRVCSRVVGVGRNAERLQRAVEAGVLDEAVTDVSDLNQVDLVVVCTPVDRLVADVSAVLQATPPETLVTDAGSVKANLCRHIYEMEFGKSRFLGAHPLAGSHQSGFENATAELYVDRTCVLTPDAESNASTIDAITRFWSGIGMRIRNLNPEEHDRVLALVSHLPHLAASAVAGLAEGELIDFAATGFRDTTRVAAGDAELWAAIFSDNADKVIAATDELILQLQRYRDALQSGDRTSLVAMLSQARDCRLRFQERNSTE